MNKFGAFEIGQKVLFQSTVCIIVDKIKGGKLNIPNKQGGIITGYKSKPCLYVLNNGYRVRGDKLKKVKDI